MVRELAREGQHQGPGYNIGQAHAEVVRLLGDSRLRIHIGAATGGHYTDVATLRLQGETHSLSEL